eukprot:4663134-Pyramimonas_sp.AAC.1
MGMNFKEPPCVVCNVLYADDTVLVSASALKVQLLLDITNQVGKQHGLDLNWSKTVVLNINNGGVVRNPTKIRPCSQSNKYTKQ